MNPDALISVVMPTHNRARLLRRALESARCQTYEALEILVVDDASTDDTTETLASIAAVEARLRIIRNETAVGPARARNIGIAAATGRLVAFLDDDDEWLPRKLERQYAALESSGADVVYCPYVYVDKRGEETVRGAVDASGGDALRRLARGNFIATPGVIARTALLREVGGFDERLPMLEDWELWLRLAARSRIAYVPEPLMRIYYSSGGITSRSGQRPQACAQIARRIEELAEGNRSLLADAHYGLGVELMLGGVPEIGRAYLRRAVQLRPWPPRRIVMALLAGLGARPYAIAARLHESLLARAVSTRLRTVAK